MESKISLLILLSIFLFHSFRVSLSHEPRPSPETQPSDSVRLMTTQNIVDDWGELSEAKKKHEETKIEGEGPKSKRGTKMQLKPEKQEGAISEVEKETEELEVYVIVKKNEKPSIHHGSGSGSVEKVCEKTEYPHVCISTVGPYAKLNPNMETVLKKTMESTIELAKLGFVRAQKLSATPGTPKQTVQALKECTTCYDKSLYNFQEAMSALSSKDVGRIGTMLSAVITDIGDCADKFTAQPSPLANYNDKVTKMTSNSLVILQSIHYN